MAPTTSRPLSKPVIRTILFTLGFLLAICTIGLLVFLAADVFTLPYLTPFAHFLAAIVSPFIPLLAPLTLGTFLKTWKHESFPQKNSWVLITGSWCFQHVQRVGTNMIALWNGGELGGMCKLNQCKAEWLEAALLLIVLFGTWLDLKWDGGMVDRWVDGLAAEMWKQDAAKKAKNEEARMEKAEEGIDETVLITADEGSVVELPDEKATLLIEDGRREEISTAKEENGLAEPSRK